MLEIYHVLIFKRNVFKMVMAVFFGGEEGWLLGVVCSAFNSAVVSLLQRWIKERDTESLRARHTNVALKRKIAESGH